MLYLESRGIDDSNSRVSKTPDQDFQDNIIGD